MTILVLSLFHKYFSGKDNDKWNRQVAGYVHFYFILFPLYISTFFIEV